jgi:hypothetical protein
VVRLEVARPLVQLLGSDALLVATRESVRSPAGEAALNGWVFGLDGQPRGRLLLGDGIEDVQATPSGEIWVSYALQGTTGDYGLHGWGRLSPEEWVDPVGYTGLVRLDAGGRLRCEFEPPADGTIMNDCFALNAWGEEAWVCYHPGLTLARVGADGRARTWRADVGAVDAIAVEGDRVLLCGGGPVPEAWAARLDEGGLADLRRLRLRLPADASGPQRLLGRGGWITSYAGDRWLRLDVASACS